MELSVLVELSRISFLSVVGIISSSPLFPSRTYLLAPLHSSTAARLVPDLLQETLLSCNSSHETSYSVSIVSEEYLDAEFQSCQAFSFPPTPINPTMPLRSPKVITLVVDFLCPFNEGQSRIIFISRCCNLLDCPQRSFRCFNGAFTFSAKRQKVLKDSPTTLRLWDDIVCHDSLALFVLSSATFTCELVTLKTTSSHLLPGFPGLFWYPCSTHR